MRREILNLEIQDLDLPLAERFTIATGSWDVARNVVVRLFYGDAVGLGEGQPAQSEGEAREAVIDALEAVDLGRLHDPFDLEGVLGLLPPGPARSALDIALHDLAATLAGISVSQLLGVGGRPAPPTSVTLPIAPVDAMVRRARTYSDQPVLKVKVGFDGDVDAVRAVRGVFGGAIRIDANEGWDLEEARARLKELEELGIELCEQPIAAGDPEGLSEVTRSTSIPIFADEDVRTAGDVAALAGVVDGVNLKLSKAGGIRETVRAISVARAYGVMVMLGCNVESGIAATAGAHVASLVDFVDLDGPLLLESDPFPGVGYERGRLELPVGPGLGVRA